MKKVVLFFALAVGLLVSATTMAQVNMSRYITLTVTDGAAIRLTFIAAADGTPVRIVSGSNTQDTTVGTNKWTSITSYTAGTTMTVYGNIIGFNCSENGANLTALDPSHNTQLKWLYCSDNNLTALDVSHNTQLTGLWCEDNNLSNLDVSHNTQLTDLACSSNHLSSLDVSQNTQLTSLGCYNNNLSSLDVSQNTQLTKLWCYNNNFTTAALDDIFCALPDRTGKSYGVIQPVFNSSDPNHAIVLATNAQNAIAKNWKVQYYNDDTDIPATTGNYVCGTPHMDIYITLTVTNGAAIKLDFRAAAAATPVRIVSGSNTQDITVGTGWKGTASYTAGSTEMKVYGDIIGFDCSDNGANLTALDVSHNTQLRKLYCRDNSLSSLNVSKNTELIGLYCYGNSFSTSALDDIFCALPDMTGKGNGVIAPVYSDTSSNHAIVLATNAQNATAKNWKVLYSNNSADITTTGSYVCPQLNTSRYITLTVTNGAAIKLDLLAAAAGTPVRIVSGSNTQNITVGTSWYGTTSYTAGSTEMKVYGDIIGFDCSDNGANLTALDVSLNTQLRKLYCRDNSLSSLNVSKNTELKGLYCYGNSFSTSALDDIYCALPVRSASDNAEIVPVESTSAPNHATVIATNAQNATAKNWKVLYSNNSADITTTGSYVCPQLNMSSYITLTVTNGAAIKLDLLAASAGTPIRIVSGSNTQDITVGNSWYNGNNPSTFTVTASASTMTIYGDLMGFACEYNGANLTALDPSHNTQLTRLWCGDNNLSNLDVSKNTQLAWLYCYSNKLSSLDLSKNTQLRGLFCHGNNFTTAALDDIFCALPVRQASDDARIQPVYSDTSSNHAIVLATNKANAIAKNWKVQYWKDNTDIPATTGSYVCPQLNMSRYITLTVANGAAIQLNFKAAAVGTPVRIVSGSNTRDITVGTDWIGKASYTAGSTTMTIYGDLIGFACSENGANLIALDPSHNTQLTGLYCYGNKFTTATLDDIYCALPDRTSETNGEIQPVYNSSSSNHATVLATNKANAIAKNWKVQYYADDTDIPTTGKHKCSATDIADASAEQALTLYPNPVADVLYLSTTARTIRIYNIYGTEVAHAADTDRVDVANLPAGIYTVRADGTVAKMVKR